MNAVKLQWEFILLQENGDAQEGGLHLQEAGQGIGKAKKGKRQRACKARTLQAAGVGSFLQGHLPSLRRKGQHHLHESGQEGGHLSLQTHLQCKTQPFQPNLPPGPRVSHCLWNWHLLRGPDRKSYCFTSNPAPWLTHLGKQQVAPRGRTRQSSRVTPTISDQS